jgi:hypothetical protein
MAAMVLAVAAVAARAQPGAPVPGGEADARFEKFKALAGDWVGKGSGEKGNIDLHINYKVTSGGNTVVETIMPGTDHEMVTLIHRDGKDVLLTHYCHLGNQPRMKAGPADGAKVPFTFTGGTNMKSEKDMHMHAVTYTFTDKNTLKAEWVLFSDGKAAGTMTMELKRKQ